MRFVHGERTGTIASIGRTRPPRSLGSSTARARRGPRNSFALCVTVAVDKKMPSQGSIPLTASKSRIKHQKIGISRMITSFAMRGAAVPPCGWVQIAAPSKPVGPDARSREGEGDAIRITSNMERPQNPSARQCRLGLFLRRIAAGGDRRYRQPNRRNARKAQ